MLDFTTIHKDIISQRNNIIFYELKYCLKSNNSDFKYNNSISFRSVDLHGSKHEQDQKAKNEIISWLKYNLEDKSAKRKISKGFEGNKSPKKDNLINKLR